MPERPFPSRGSRPEEPDRGRSRIQKPRLLFDGECGFCTGIVDWLRPRFVRPVEIIPWQRADLEELELTPKQADEYVWWLEVDGERHRGHHAVVRALESCKPPWPRIGRIMGIRALSPFAALSYHGISAIRHWLPGTQPACQRGGQDRKE